MVFIKDVSSNADAGTASKWGGNDINFLDDYFDDVDITPKVGKINTRTYFRSGKFEWRDSDNSHSYIIVAGNITANRNINIPVLSADDTLAFTGINNTFSTTQTIAAGAVTDYLYLYRATGVNGDAVDINFDLQDSLGGRDTYCDLRTSIVDNTSGSEDGRFVVNVMENGSKGEKFRIDQDGQIRVNLSAGTGTAAILYRNRNTVGDNCSLDFAHQDSASNQTTYASIRSEIIDNTDASEDGKLEFLTRQNGTLNENLILYDDGSLDVTRNRLQVKRDAASTLLELYRTDNGAGNSVDLIFFLEDSGNAQQQYCKLSGEIVTNTAGSEDGKLSIYNHRAGSEVKVSEITQIGLLKIGRDTSNLRNVPSIQHTSGTNITVNTNATEQNLLNQTVKGGIMNNHGSIHVRMGGTCLQNQATGTTYTFAIKFGGTTLWSDTGPSIAQSATRFPWLLDFTIFNKNATNSQGMIGFIMVNDTATATTGLGDAADDEQSVNANFSSSADPAKDTTADQTVLVTITMSVSNAAVETRQEFARIEVWPSN